MHSTVHSSLRGGARGHYACSRRTLKSGVDPLHLQGRPTRTLAPRATCLQSACVLRPDQDWQSQLVSQLGTLSDFSIILIKTGHIKHFLDFSRIPIKKTGTSRIRSSDFILIFLRGDSRTYWFFFRFQLFHMLHGGFQQIFFFRGTPRSFVQI